MKRITLTLFGLLLANLALAQTYSTGTVTLFSDYSAKLDISNTTVTLTMIGPSASWLGLGFNTTTMASGNDAVLFDGTVISDRRFNGVGFTPLVDATQNWSITSNTSSAGVTTMVATRARSTGDSNDFTFSFPPTAINVVFARGISNVVDYHGLDNCGTTAVSFSLLGIDSFDIESFKLYPNPAKSFVTLELPQLVSEADVIIYDMLGKKVIETKVTLENSRIETSRLNSGSYLMNIKTIDGEGTKTLVIQ
ncbi:T9SS type A sorting domain-containing protein [Flavobacterium enshiense]|uniref:T9SS type A sorting domain-containing protein n=1 Tax=Flavobacterium enshiense TaxID=1341165 RepID=UPI00345D4236